MRNVFEAYGLPTEEEYNAQAVACDDFIAGVRRACARLRDSRNGAARRRASRCAGRSLIRSPHIELEAATNPTNGVRNADPTDGG